MLIDYRENRSNVPILLNQFNVPFQISNLAVDYIISKDCFVERKTVDDFITSIADSRIFKQVRYLAQNCINPLLILEGDGLYIHGRMNANAIRGVILWITLVKKVAFIQTHDEYDSACILLSLARKYGSASYVQTKSFPLKHKVKSFWQRQVDLLTQIPGIGPKIAKDLLNSFGSISNIIQTADSELINSPFIGKERLESIRQIFPFAFKKEDY